MAVSGVTMSSWAVRHPAKDSRATRGRANHGCRLGQGWVYARAMTADDFEAALRSAPNPHPLLHATDRTTSHLSVVV